MALQYKETTVEVGLGKNPDGTEKVASQTYQQVVKASVTTDDILTLLQDPKTAQQLISDWHYGQDLRSKSQVRQAILALQPVNAEKSFEKQVKLFMQTRAANGKPVTEDQARKIVKMMDEMEAESEAEKVA